MAQENKALPRDTVLLSVARGADLVPLVNDLTRLMGQWDREQKKKDEVEAWERRGKELGIYNPASSAGKSTRQSSVLGPDGRPTSSADIPPPASPDPKGPDGDDDDENVKPVATFYSVQLSGDFSHLLATVGYEAITQYDLAELLKNLADALAEGDDVTCPSSITISPVSKAEQSV